MVNIFYIIIGIAVSLVSIFFIVMGHDLYLMQASNDKMENEWVKSYNQTSKCPDLQYILNNSKDYWVHGDIYNKLNKFYEENNCDKVLKK